VNVEEEVRKYNQPSERPNTIDTSDALTVRDQSRSHARNRPTSMNPLAIASGKKDVFQVIGERQRRQRKSNQSQNTDN
jgi:hypothetical protein